MNYNPKDISSAPVQNPVLDTLKSISEGNIRALHRQLLLDGYLIPEDYDTFKETLEADPVNVGAIYNEIRNTYDVGSFEQFYNSLFPQAVPSVQASAYRKVRTQLIQSELEDRLKEEQQLQIEEERGKLAHGLKLLDPLNYSVYEKMYQEGQPPEVMQAYYQEKQRQKE